MARKIESGKFRLTGIFPLRVWKLTHYGLVKEQNQTYLFRRCHIRRGIDAEVPVA